MKEGLGFIAVILFLSCLAGAGCAVIPAVELCAVLELLGIDPGLWWSFGPMDCVFILGFFVVLWFSEGGPSRPGRGILRGDAPALIGASVFNFFLIAGLVLAVVYWMR